MTTKLTFGLILSLGLATTAFAQQGRVGINTPTPAATLDVVAKNTDPAVVDGVIAPRLTGDELQAKDGVYLGPQTGALVYATAAVTTPSGTKTAKVTSAGYYYFDGAIWQKVANPTVATGDTTDDEWINNTASTRIELGKTSAKAARAAGAEFVALDNGNVGIGLTGPGTKLEITSTGTNNPLKLNNLQTGASTDNILTVDASGNVRQVVPNAAVGAVKSVYNLVGTTTQTVPVGTTVDVAGLSQTITVPAGKSSIMQITATGYAAPPLGLTVQASQGAFGIVVDGVKVTSGYVSSSDSNGAYLGNANALTSQVLIRLPSSTTITTLVTLAPGTHTIKVNFKAWYANQQINTNAFTTPYGGADSGDVDALKSRLTIIEFNN